MHNLCLIIIIIIIILSLFRHKILHENTFYKNSIQNLPCSINPKVSEEHKISYLLIRDFAENMPMNKNFPM